jgi:prepilin-type processing-associated H-X9-DG protein
MPLRAFDRSNLDTGSRSNQFWSRHPGGAQFAFADESIRLIKEKRPLAIFHSLATRQAGEVVSADSY